MAPPRCTTWCSRVSCARRAAISGAGAQAIECEGAAARRTFASSQTALRCPQQRPRYASAPRTRMAGPPNWRPPLLRVEFGGLRGCFRASPEVGPAGYGCSRSARWCCVPGQEPRPLCCSAPKCASGDSADIFLRGCGPLRNCQSTHRLGIAVTVPRTISLHRIESA